jgi:hypothetical protein
MKRMRAQEQNWKHKNWIEAETTKQEPKWQCIKEESTKTTMQTQMIYKY